MKISTVIGYVQMAVGGLYVLIATVLTVLQWGNTCQFSFFGQNHTFNTAELILVSAAAGIITIYMCKLLYRGSVTVYKSRPAATQPPAQTPPAA